MANEEGNKRYQQLISSLPLYDEFGRNRRYKGWWYPEPHLAGLLAFNDDFSPRDTDLFLMSPPKSGTTWLKALAFATVHRKDYSPFSQHHPLLRMHPHDCVPMVDELFWQGQECKLNSLPSPRILSMHAPYQLLPVFLTSTNSKCKLIYICREPKDAVVSGWHFAQGMLPSQPVPFSGLFETYCEGKSSFGALWDHALGYWTESLQTPSKILFLKYEEMMEEPEENVRKIAEFVGCPFSQEEEEGGVVEEIVRLCSFEKLSGVEVNKTGDRGLEGMLIKNSTYFRKGRVGDWKNYFTKEMAEKMDVIIEEKVRGSGLTFGCAK